MEIERALEEIAAGLELFFQSESKLLDVDANERSITHKLAEHLKPRFNEWDVDCEYNRDGVNPKRLPLPLDARADDTDGTTIFPDIIIHKRRSAENLAAIEVKKKSSRRNSDLDTKKLIGLTTKDGEYGYDLGLFLEIDCEDKRISKCWTYVNGSEINMNLAPFQKFLK